MYFISAQTPLLQIPKIPYHTIYHTLFFFLFQSFNPTRLCRKECARKIERTKRKDKKQNVCRVQFSYNGKKKRRGRREKDG
ncbi:hypothetical protein HMPREF3213_02318 [Heyndrickxia coagulans]|uniref:Uncharacterized protein n=1 Tax=Heyndrickxia coagulans TaxID=1398 RepID=A0A133KLD3_HEYCO|nr:hypothetical protein HMPREF3213_02318 [Heyndrickxia coagulans]